MPVWHTEATSPEMPYRAAPQIDAEFRSVHVNGGSEITLGLLHMMLRFIDEHIEDVHLGPGRIAQEFRISKRYVHKVFATTGSTFTSYVTGRRLERVCNALIAVSPQQELIASIARRWGFRDISAFNRAFKRRFGCSPRVFRTRRAGWRR